jgi:hypothetical protein
MDNGAAVSEVFEVPLVLISANAVRAKLNSAGHVSELPIRL